MANLTATPGPVADLTAAPAPRATPVDRWIGAGIVVALLAVVAIRTLASGWSSLAPDDARYLYVGLSVLAGDGPLTPGGGVFLLRSPVYGVLLASGSLAGLDPVTGAHLIAVTLAVLAMIGAVRLGWLLGGAGGALGVGVALLATPLVWRLLPTLRVDLAQAAGVVAVLLALWRPTARRWALAGVLFGLTVLVKETVLPLMVLPLALVGLVPPRRLMRLWAGYAVAAVATAAWWWVVVWVGAGAVFPANALGVIEARDVAMDLQVGRGTVAVLGVAIVAWIVVLIRARRRPGERLLVGAAVGLLPAALYAFAQGLNARNYLVLAVLSAVAVGAAGAWLAAVVARRATRGRPDARGPIRVAGIVLVAVVLAGAALAGQRTVGQPSRDDLADTLVAWIREHTSDGDRIAMPFRDREVVALDGFGRTDVGHLSVRRVGASDPLDAYLWLGLRDEQLFGYRRAAWEDILDGPPARYLILSGPHAFTPDELLGTMTSGSMPGIALVDTLASPAGSAAIFDVDPTADTTEHGAVPLHLAPAAALAWLDLAAATDGEAVAVERLLAETPVVVGDDLAPLLDRVGDRACAVETATGGTRLRPAGTCPA